MLRHVGLACRAARNEQGRAGLDEHLRRNLVHLAQRGFAHPDLRRRLGRLERLRRDPGGPARGRPAVRRQAVQEAVRVVVGQQQLRRAGGEDHRLVHVRVEGLELLQRHARQPHREFDVDVALDRHAQEVRVVGQRRQHQAEALRPGDDVLHRLQLGHVVARLVGHLQARVVGRQSGLLVARDGALHAAFAPVVGGQRELPVAELRVKPRQVVERGTRRREHVAPVVAEDVLLQVEVLARGGHELPHARGLARSTWPAG